IAGKEYLVPLRYVGDQINPSILLSLGNDIVLKRNDDSGSSVVIEQNSLEISKKACRAVIQKAGYGQRTNEWWYRAIPAKFLVEERLSDAAQPDHLVEYRFFVFGSASGSPKAYIEVIRRNASHQPECSFFDLNGNPLSFDGEHVSYVGCRPIAGGFPAIDAIPELLSVAQKLSQGHSFIRVDLHYVSGKVFFGELTFNPAEGRFRVSPPAFDFEMGNQWELPILQGDRDAA
ncbi:MAG: ATP-grasp fold amidoligase family protein, partial [Verrucomicrobiota bacterium]